MTKDELYELIRAVGREVKGFGEDLKKLRAAFEQLDKDPAFTPEDIQSVRAFFRKTVVDPANDLVVPTEPDKAPWEQQATRFERERDG